MELEAVMPIVIAAIGSAGLWGFLSLRSKQAHEKALKDEERSAEWLGFEIRLDRTSTARARIRIASAIPSPPAAATLRSTDAFVATSL